MFITWIDLNMIMIIIVVLMDYSEVKNTFPPCQDGGEERVAGRVGNGPQLGEAGVKETRGLKERTKKRSC
jgi:hypothetical protein